MPLFAECDAKLTAFVDRLYITDLDESNSISEEMCENRDIAFASDSIVLNK